MDVPAVRVEKRSYGAALEMSVIGRKEQGDERNTWVPVAPRTTIVFAILSFGE